LAHTSTEQRAQVLTPDPAELLIEEARTESRRRRLRRSILLIVVATLILSLVALVAMFSPTRTTTTNGASKASSISVPLCTASNIRISDRGTDVGGGSWIQLFQLKNVGNNACSISGYPGVSTETARGVDRTLAVTLIRYEAARKIGDSRRGPLTPSNLAAHGGVASFWITGSDTPLRNLHDCQFATKVSVTLPRGPGTLAYEVGRIPFSYCENEVGVTPVLPGRSGSLPLEQLKYFDLQR
jgi:hypothetical protein